MNRIRTVGPPVRAIVARSPADRANDPSPHSPITDRSGRAPVTPRDGAAQAPLGPRRDRPATGLAQFKPRGQVGRRCAGIGDEDCVRGQNPLQLLDDPPGMEAAVGARWRVLDLRSPCGLVSRDAGQPAIVVGRWSGWRQGVVQINRGVAGQPKDHLAFAASQ
ncbi:MAG: hypothetical protein PVH11_09460 [Anaerolineae bacterium]